MSRKINPKRLSIDQEYVKYEILTVSADTDVEPVYPSLFNLICGIDSLDDLMRFVNKTNYIDLVMPCEIGNIFGCPCELVSEARAFKRYVQSSFNVDKCNIVLRCHKHETYIHESRKGLLSDLYPNKYSDVDCPNKLKLKYVATEVYPVVSYSFVLVYKYR